MMKNLQDFQQDEKTDIMCDSKADFSVWAELWRKVNHAETNSFGKYIYEFDNPQTWKDLIYNKDKQVEPPT